MWSSLCDDPHVGVRVPWFLTGVLFLGFAGCSEAPTSSVSSAVGSPASSAAGSPVHSNRESLPPTGEWNLFRPQQAASPLSDEQVDQIRKLQTLGYVAGSAEPTTDLVITQHDRQRACHGLNLYTSGHGPEAILMDMEGNELHRWQCRFEDAFPESPLKANPIYMMNYWRRASLFENGDLLVIFEGLGLVKLNSDSEVVWSQLNGAHHDMQVMPDGRIFVLARTVHIVPHVDPVTPTVEDFVVVLDASGAELKRFHCSNAVRMPDFRMRRMFRSVSRTSAHIRFSCWTCTTPTRWKCWTGALPIGCPRFEPATCSSPSVR